MSIVRVGQYPFEMNYAQTDQEDRGLYIRWGDSYFFGEAATLPYTGDRSLYFSARADAGIGFTFPLADDLRGGWFMRLVSESILSQSFLKLFESDNTTPLLEVRSNVDERSLELYINDGLVQSANLIEFPESMQTGLWCHHGWHVIGGSRFVYYIDGVAALDYTNVAVPTQFESVFCLEAFQWGITSVDDFWVEIVAGESMAPVPAYRFLMSVVDGDGGSRGWANYPNSGDDFEKVDDVTVDDDATYNWINSSGTVQMYTTAAIAVPFGYSVSAAIPWCLGRKGDISKASQIRMKADDGVGTTNGSDWDLPGFYAEQWERMLLDPQSVAWDQTSFNACEFGFESRGTI